MKLALKVDVDTQVGTRDGVPRLKRILDERGIKASFFLSLGPDNSGRALFRVFSRPGFLLKQFRTRAPSAYGLRTLMMGLLIPAPIIGQGQGDLVRSLVESGHEVGLHAWDHVRWHDRLWKMPEAEVRAEVRRGLEAFHDLCSCAPKGFAAPAWRINAAAVDELARAGLTYLAASRGRAPFRPCLEGCSFDLIELPTTLPTADEVLGRGGLGPDDLPEFFAGLIFEPGFHVLTIHAEMEGRGLAPQFERLLDLCLAQGVTFVRLIDAAEELLRDRVRPPRAEVIRTELPGRPGPVSFQGPEL